MSGSEVMPSPGGAKGTEGKGAGLKPATGKTPDLKAEVLRAVKALGQPGQHGNRAMTSDLTIDEELVLHSVGWEPVELVTGVSLYSVPVGVWNWGQGEIALASSAHAHAFAWAVKRLEGECTKAGGHGVVGVQVERSVHRHHIDVELVGTAVRPVGSSKPASGSVFASDLSARDFTLLEAAGWEPVGLAFGASFVYAPRRSAGTAIQQKGQNIELTNFTEAMYSAREMAMERMQGEALKLRGSGVVEVKVTEGPVHFAHHAIGFTAWGTAVRLAADKHRYLRPAVLVPLDDPVVSFDAGALRG